MKKDFTQWKNDYGLEFEPNYSKETELDCKASYEAGQQSRQTEIDELQKRIELALDHTTNHGGYDDLIHIINILKGGANE